MTVTEIKALRLLFQCPNRVFMEGICSTFPAPTLDFVNHHV